MLAELLGSCSLAERRERQLLCNDLGASTLVLKFGACEDGALCQAGLQLGGELTVSNMRPSRATAVPASLLLRL